ncbi:MAG: RagB/SusD family nutrient uptake outer membrane protein [Tannerella sp.]|jgi:tetratricopeptide (TPR) repeat protein|nr:RagB/SusD family nutrient uptake outer membrane protein [Tannerella sp.]
MRTNIFNNLTSAFLLLSLLFPVSCADQLDKSPTNQFDNATFWTNETNALIGLTAVYRGGLSYDFQTAPTDWWSYAGLAFMELATDNAYDRRGNSSTLNRLTDGTLLPNNNVLLSFWTGSYKKITVANDFLDHIELVPIDQSKISRFKAEARFLRACQYFYLSQHFGSVPLVTKILTSEEANTVQKASKSEIESFVESEFKDAITDLPRYKDIPASEIGRVSKQAALAFLGRLYLAQKKYREAADTYKQIIDFGDNTIDPDYSGLFTPANENSKENIFSMQFIEVKAPNYLPQHAYPAIAGGWHFINPLEDLAVNYDFIDGTPFSYDDTRFNLNNRAENRDPRFAYSFLWDGCTFGGKIYDCHPDHASSVDQLTVSKQATRTGYGLRKFFDESFSGDLATGYGGNMPIIRYAEVLLSYLEAIMEAGDPISQSLLDETINKVRGRTSVKMPSITETNTDKLRPVLRKERRIELAFEGIRLWDILRWGIAGEVLKGDFWGAPFPDSTGSLNLPNGYTKDPYSRWWVTTKNFRTGQDELWPIPETETNINPNLK